MGVLPGSLGLDEWTLVVPPTTALLISFMPPRSEADDHEPEYGYDNGDSRGNQSPHAISGASGPTRLQSSCGVAA